MLKKILTIFFWSQSNAGGTRSWTEDDDHERRATEDGGMEGVGEDRVGEEGDAG